MTAASLAPGSVLSLDGPGWEAHGYLGEEWRFREGHTPHGRERDWVPATVPGSVLEDLRRAAVVPDPYVGRNSLLCEWVPQRTWLYRRRFALPPGDLPPRVALRLDGIDYAGGVYLNGEWLGRHEGTFVPAAWDVRDLLHAGADNLLAVALEPAPVSEPQVARTERVALHKPRMGYGWDFCPRLVHVGIWDSVLLHGTGPLRLADVHVRAEPTPGRGARVRVSATIDGPGDARVDVDVLRGRETLAQATAAAHDGRAELELSLRDAAPWWSNGLGAQPLLVARVRVLDADDGVSDERTVRFGIRTVKLEHNDGAPPDALPYTLVVNGRRTPIRGWNWVPLDASYGPRRPGRLAHLLDLARSARVNLLRVWGGGLIEREDFYDACDERGILVWQEFSQSSSGISSVPSAEPPFVERMRREAEAIVPRRRNHPSLAIWGGGNELTSADGSPIDERHPVIRALADAVRRLDPGRAWLPSSPSGRAFLNRLDIIEADPEAQHDVHGPWEHQGPYEHYRLYNAGSSLLHSEFGVEGMANRRTLEAVVPAGERWPADRSNPTYEHLGAWWNNAQSVIEWFGGDAFAAELQSLDEADRLATLRRSSQLLQADGLRYAVESSRRRWPRSAGTLPWQFNEPFPNAWCTSVVDYHGRPKPAYWAVAEAYRPLIVGAILERQAPVGAATLAVTPWVLSEDGRIEGLLRVRLLRVDGTVVNEHAQACAVEVSFTGAHVRLSLDATRSAAPSAVLVLEVILETVAQARAATRRYLLSSTADLAPLRAVPETRLVVDTAPEGLTVRNAGDSIAVGVEVVDDRPVNNESWLTVDCGWFHLLPGEERSIAAASNGAAHEAPGLVVSAWNAPSVAT